MKERIEHMDLIKALNLYYLDNYSPKVIAEITNISHTTIYKYIKKIKENNLTWPIDESKLNNKTIEEYFYAAQNIRKDFNDEFEYTYRELKKHRHLTKLIVYNELIKSSKISISYSHFSKLYKQWSNTQTLSMRMDHIGGEIVYVDYAGLKLSIIMSDGLCYDCPVFVGTLGASGFVFVDITLTQSQEDWINSHIRMLEYFNGTPQIIVPDNLKTGVIKADIYNPDINKTYLHMARHYNIHIMPARVCKPKDKALVEGSVYNVSSNILSPLRNKKIHGINEARKEVLILLHELNNKPFQKLSTSRQELFFELDKPNLGQLPAYKYLYQQYKKVRVSNDYHILIEDHLYSVPYKLVDKELDVWYSETEVKIYNKLDLVKIYERSYKKKCKTTSHEHMPNPHQKHCEITKDKLLNDAKVIDVVFFNYAIEVLNFLKNEKYFIKKLNGINKLSKRVNKSDFINLCQNFIESKLFDPEYMIKSLKNLKI